MLPADATKACITHLPIAHMQEHGSALPRGGHNRYEGALMDARRWNCTWDVSKNGTVPSQVPRPHVWGWQKQSAHRAGHEEWGQRAWMGNRRLKSPELSARGPARPGAGQAPVMAVQIEALGSWEHTSELLFTKPQNVRGRSGRLFPFKRHTYF